MPSLTSAADVRFLRYTAIMRPVESPCRCCCSAALCKPKSCFTSSPPAYMWYTHMTPHPLPVLRLATHLARRSRRWSVREMRCICRCLFTQRKRKQSLRKRHGREALTGPDLYPSHVWCAAALCGIFKLCSVGVASPVPPCCCSPTLRHL